MEKLTDYERFETVINFETALDFKHTIPRDKNNRHIEMVMWKHLKQSNDASNKTE